MRFLPRLFRKAIRKGRLTLSAPGFGPETFGGEAPGPEVAIRFTDASWDWKILLNPELRFAEAYMDSVLVVEKGSIADLVNIFYVNKRRFDMSANQIAVNGVLRKLKRFQQHNPIARSRANAEAHYNIGNDLYRLFLDEDMQYSCAYFPTGKETLEEAQLLKKRLIASKLRLGRVGALSRQGRGRRGGRRVAGERTARPRPRARKGRGPGTPRLL